MIHNDQTWFPIIWVGHVETTFDWFRVTWLHHSQKRSRKEEPGKNNPHTRWFKPCPFHPLVGGHLTPWKGHVNSPSQKGHELNQQKFGIMGIMKLSSRKIQNDLDLFWRNGDFLTDLYKQVRRHQFWPFICESFLVWFTFSKHRDVWWNNHHFILCHDLVFKSHWSHQPIQNGCLVPGITQSKKRFGVKLFNPIRGRFVKEIAFLFETLDPPRKLTNVTGWKIHHVH